MNMDSKQPPSTPPDRALGDHFETALDRAARAAEPPDYDQLAAYVDGTLDDVDREIVESWLDSDPELRAEVEDLRALHDAMGQPAATPALPAEMSAGSPAVPSARRAEPGTPTTTRGSEVATSASASPSGVLPFERPPVRRAMTGRFRTATVIMGAMAAAVIGAVTWMAVRTARVDDARPGAGAAGSQVARQPEQSQQTPQRPPVQSRGAGAPQVAVRDAGGLIAIDAAGTVTGLTGDAASQPMTQLVADALTKGTLPPAAAAAGLGGRELTLMSRSRQAPAARLTPLTPIATIVRSARPVFRWSPHPGARNYVVTIYGPDFERVTASPSVTDTTWTTIDALKPGMTYQWQVTADTPDGVVRAPAPPAPDARFRVIDTASGKTLDRDLARAGASQLLKGLLLTQAGVLDEAEEAFVALQAANPDSKRVADLLSRVRDRRLMP
jgi:anti-sigma factor RsiW